MLTTGLEKAIQQGDAIYKTFAVGGSGVGTIPVLKNRFIVIIDFDWFPFSDTTVLTDFVTRSVYQISFRDKKSQNHFIVRNPVGIIPGQFAQIITLPFHKDVYLTHIENVQIDIVNVPSPTLWAGINYSPLPAISQEKPQPVGYGVAGQPAVREIDFSATQNYLPLTNKRDDLVTANYREQFYVDVNAANKLNAPFVGGGGGNQLPNYTYPIMNVSYVEFQMNYNDYVQASN